MNPSDLHALTGAYALNALDDDERGEFEAHLAECPACQQEVREFAATAAEVGGSLAVTPPPDLKAQVMGAISATPQERPIPRAPAQAGDEATSVVAFPRRRLLDRVLLPAAAVLAVLVVGLAATVGNLNTRVNELEASTVRVADIVAAPDLRTWSLTQNGTTARVVYSATQGQGLFLAAGLQPPPDGKVYELWLIGADGATPAGLFTSSGGSVTHPMTGDVVSATHIGVTIEPAGGSPQPTTDPILVLEL